jgi:hypothetical protein
MGRWAVGGALLLGGVLTAAPAGATPHGDAPTQVSAPAHAQRSGASVVGLAVSLAAGPSFARAKARYDPAEFIDGPAAPSFDSHSAVAPGGALTLTMGGHVGSRLLVGGAITIGLGVLPNRFAGDREVKGAFGVGPELVLLPSPRGGVFAFARGGVGVLNALAWSAAVGGGYALPLGKTMLVGLGLELSGVYSRFGEDGDFGTYTYKDEILAPALVARLML